MYGFVFNSCTHSDPEKQQLKEHTREQNKIKSKVNISLRAAHVAYNVNRYDLAVDKYNIAINAGWLDGIDLYKYADSLENEGKTEESRIYFQRAYNELQKFYPNHSFIQVLESRGYRQSL